MSEEVTTTGNSTVVETKFSSEGAALPPTTESSTKSEKVYTKSDKAPAKQEAAAKDFTPTGDISAKKEVDDTISQYQPNFKFTVKDKEHEFDEWLRPVVKTKEEEEKLRDLYSKAFGIEEVKADRQTIKEKYSQLEAQTEQINDSLTTLGKYVREGDYRSFFEALQIPKEQVIQFAMEELKYLELPQEEQNRIEQERAMKAQLAQYEQQTMTLQQQQEQLVAQQVKRDLSYELEKPEISQVAQSFDARVGKPGAFQQEVLKRGAYYEAIHKTSPPAQQVVMEVVNLVGSQMASAGQPAMNNQTFAQHPGAENKKPVIPNLGGSGSTSPTRKVPGSIEDLRKIRQNMMAQQG